MVPIDQLRKALTDAINVAGRLPPASAAAFVLGRRLELAGQATAGLQQPCVPEGARGLPPEIRERLAFALEALSPIDPAVVDGEQRRAFLETLDMFRSVLGGTFVAPPGDA